MLSDGGWFANIYPERRRDYSLLQAYLLAIIWILGRIFTRFRIIFFLLIGGNRELDASGGVLLVLKVRERKLSGNAIWHNRVLPIAHLS